MITNTNKIDGPFDIAQGSKPSRSGGFGLIWMRFVMAGFLIGMLLMAAAFGWIAAILITVLVVGFTIKKGLESSSKITYIVNHYIAMDQMYHYGAKAAKMKMKLKTLYNTPSSDRVEEKQVVAKESKTSIRKLHLAMAK